MVSVMSCYRPMLALYDGDGSYKLAGRYQPGMETLFPGSVSVPCGKCLGCRLDYSRQWADRMMLELDHTGKAIFITLTYDEEHVPVSMLDDDDIPSAYTLWKPDFQDFMKRLRSRKKFEDRELRFYASGEYGSCTQRPHYHAIIFGLSLSDFPDRVLRGVNELNQEYYISEEFGSIWPNGFHIMTAVSWQTCAYVARYVMKKVNSPVDHDPAFRNSEPEFALMSRRPGLGFYYLLEHPDMFERSVKYVPGSNSPESIRPPKYLLKKLELIDPDLYAKICEDRLNFARDSVMLKLQKTDLSFIELLELEEEAKWKKIQQLKRK